VQLRTKLAAVGGAAALVLAAGVPALASSHTASKPVTGPEAFYGAVHGKKATANNPVIPLKWQGATAAALTYIESWVKARPGRPRQLLPSALRLYKGITMTRRMRCRSCVILTAAVALCAPNGAELAKGAVAQFTGSAVLTAP
jgi:hypothetical protein